VRGERGSILPAALFLCLALGSLIAYLAAHTLVATEAVGLHREALEADGRLGGAMIALLRGDQRELGVTVELPDGVRGALLAAEGERGPRAYVELPEGPPFKYLSAILEEGREGLDFPKAAIVANRVQLSGLRPFVLPDVGSRIPVVRTVEELPALPGTYETLPSERWDFDSATSAELRDSAENPDRRAGRRLPGLNVIIGRPLLQLALAAELPSILADQNQPVLAVSLDGDIDARNLGELQAVLVAGGGDVLLDGTTLKGAVIASGTVDLGETGVVWWDEETYYWARDQSFRRVRLLPGSLQAGFREISALP